MAKKKPVKKASKKSTKKKSTKKKVVKKKTVKKVKAKTPVPPVGENVRADVDAIIGQPAEWKGIEGTISRVTTYDKNGYAELVVFRPRRNMNSPLSVKYKDVQPLLNGFR